MTHTTSRLVLSAPLVYVETTIPSGMTIDDYRRSRPRAAGGGIGSASGHALSGNADPALGQTRSPVDGRDGSVDWSADTSVAEPRRIALLSAPGAAGVARAARC
jgi:hypothetical protein